jgi:Na+-translocating ferredoxin:NAD+ oxidoreductase RnfG subunit
MGMPDFGPTQPAGCEGRIDFLFVISSQGTMKGSSGAVVAAVPGFIATIQEQFSEFDTHVLVASTDRGLEHRRL